MNSTLLLNSAIDIVEGFQNYEPATLFNLADFLCAFTAAFSLRYRWKEKINTLSFAIATFLMCFGGSTMTNFVHGLMMGYLRRSTGFISYLCGFACILSLPQSIIDGVFQTSFYQFFAYIVDAFLRVHCVTSWGADTAIHNHGSVVSATFSSIATGCGGGILAAILLDTDSQCTLMEKLVRVLTSRQREIEHLLTMSLFYQLAIGFIPCSYLQPIHPFIAKVFCLGLFFSFDWFERLTGIRLFIPLSIKKQKEEKQKEEWIVCLSKQVKIAFSLIYHLQHTYILKVSNHYINNIHHTS